MTAKLGEGGLLGAQHIVQVVGVVAHRHKQAGAYRGMRHSVRSRDCDLLACLISAGMGARPGRSHSVAGMSLQGTLSIDAALVSRSVLCCIVQRRGVQLCNMQHSVMIGAPGSAGAMEAATRAVLCGARADKESGACRAPAAGFRTTLQASEAGMWGCKYPACQLVHGPT